MAKRLPRREQDATLRLTSRQIELLALFSVQHNAARFTSPERINDWAAVKEVFTLLGATWKRGKRGEDGSFVFPDDSDGAAVLEQVAATGEVIDPRKAGFFPTPPEVADLVVGYLRLGELLVERDLNLQILEPSAGEGALCDAVRRITRNTTMLCYELLAKNRSALTSKGYRVLGEDFLAHEPIRCADAVVMNPPFNMRSDVAHVQQAYRWLKPGSPLVAIMSGGTLFRSDRETTGFRAWVQSLGGSLTKLPERSFVASGTAVSSILCVIRSPAID